MSSKFSTTTAIAVVPAVVQVVVLSVVAVLVV